jgi:hypothetical protein
MQHMAHLLREDGDAARNILCEVVTQASDIHFGITEDDIATFFTTDESDTDSQEQGTSNPDASSHASSDSYYYTAFLNNFQERESMHNRDVAGIFDAVHPEEF